MEKTLFEQMGGTFTQQGDYLLPDLTVSPEGTRLLGYGGSGENGI